MGSNYYGYLNPLGTTSPLAKRLPRSLSKNFSAESSKIPGAGNWVRPCQLAMCVYVWEQYQELLTKGLRLCPETQPRNTGSNTQHGLNSHGVSPLHRTLTASVNTHSSTAWDGSHGSQWTNGQRSQSVHARPKGTHQNARTIQTGFPQHIPYPPYAAINAIHVPFNFNAFQL